MKRINAIIKTDVPPIEIKIQASRGQDLKQRTIPRTTLIREVYRTLISSGRSYAAFTDKELRLVESLKDKEEILDPMSGYGVLTQYCAQHGLSSYCVEYNLPQYLWQVLSQPANSDGFIKCAKLMLSWKSKWPKTEAMASVSDTWFTEESNRLLKEMLTLVRKGIKNSFVLRFDENELALAFLLPFVGRFSCAVPGDISTHVKMGGMCVYTKWEDDFETYLSGIGDRLAIVSQSSISLKHTVRHGDARSYSFPKGRFAAMITSPPYPNHRDFVSMFLPEHSYLSQMSVAGAVASRQADEHVIGSNFVAERTARDPKSDSVRRFINAIRSLKRSTQASYDDDTYYIPYFAHYFADLEEAYENVSKALMPKAEGYIIVVNNTHRNLIVPVSDAVIEIWRSLGFDAEIFESSESFHIGAKNPRAKGLRARHSEYIIRIWR